MSTIYDTRSTQATAHHATCVVTVEIWVTNAPIMLLPLALLGSPLARLSSRVGYITTLTPQYVSAAVTSSARLLNVYNTFEQMLRPSTRTEFSNGTSHRVLCARCAPRVIHRFVAFCGSQVSACSELFPYQQVMDRLLIHVYRIMYRRWLWAQYVESSF